LQSIRRGECFFFMDGKWIKWFSCNFIFKLTAMRKVFLVIAVSFSLLLSAQNNKAYFLSNPSLTPDGQTVIFSFEGDLWKANIKDGQASRLTAMQGYETSAKVSPDGKWIAFTGRQYGNADVFVMPVDGG